MTPPYLLYPETNPDLHKLTTIDLIGGIYCNVCGETFKNKVYFDAHYIQHNNSNGSIYYTCVVCRKEILGYRSFRGHCYTAHVIKTRFKCSTCSKCFSKQSALTEHEARHKFICRPCNKEFESDKELQFHKIIHKDNGPPYPCQICHVKIGNIDTCKEHVEIHAAFTYLCPICNETFSEKPIAGQHLTTHFDGDTPSITMQNNWDKTTEDCSLEVLGGILCSYCFKTYKNKSDFDVHFENEHEGIDIIYSCNECASEFSKYFLFSNHCYNHYVKERYQCDNCKKSFSRLSLLIAHNALCDSTSEGISRPFTCTYCEAKFAYEMGLRAHLNQQHNVTNLMCADCGEKFQKMKELIMHRRNHKNIDKLCSQCGLEFKSLISCEKHLDVHHKKAYPCPICSKVFGEKYMAMKHVQQHFQSVLYVCNICRKIYNARFRLVAHQKIHANDKSFQCKICGKGFITPYTFEQHMNTHADQKPYQCVVCTKEFTSYPNWCKHVKKIHNIDPKKIKKTMQQAQLENEECADEAKPISYVKNIVFVNEVENVKYEGNDIHSHSNMSQAASTESDGMKMENIDSNLSILQQDIHNIYSDSFGIIGPEIEKPVEKQEGSIKVPENVVLKTEQDINCSEPKTDMPLSSPTMVDDDIYFYIGSESDSNLKVESLLQQDILNLNYSFNDASNDFSSCVPDNILVLETPPTVPTLQNASPDITFPREYGPDFINYPTLVSPYYNTQVIPLDDHIMPHIDPMLTIKEENQRNLISLKSDMDQYVVTSEPESYMVKLEPPIITKIFNNYSYDHMTDSGSNLMSFLKADILIP